MLATETDGAKVVSVRLAVAGTAVLLSDAVTVGAKAVSTSAAVDGVTLTDPAAPLLVKPLSNQPSTVLVASHQLLMSRVGS